MQSTNMQNIQSSFGAGVMFLTLVEGLVSIHSDASHLVWHCIAPGCHQRTRHFDAGGRLLTRRVHQQLGGETKEST